MGFEPTNGGTTIHCLNPLATLAIFRLSIIAASGESNALYSLPALG